MEICIGQSYHRLKVLSINKNSCECVCTCGTIKVVNTYKLVTGHTKSCGCLAREILYLRNFKHGCSYRGKQDAEYEIWSGMKSRCYNTKNHTFAHYGGRGITVDPRWHDFTNFIADMGKLPTANHSIERIDNNGNYSPENCKWATLYEQNNNKSSNRLLLYNGHVYTMRELSDKIGINYKTLRSRLNLLKLTVKESVELPLRFNRIKSK